MVYRLVLSIHPPHVLPPLSARALVQVVEFPTFPLDTWHEIVGNEVFWLLEGIQLSVVKDVQLLQEDELGFARSVNRASSVESVMSRIYPRHQLRVVAMKVDIFPEIQPWYSDMLKPPMVLKTEVRLLREVWADPLAIELMMLPSPKGMHTSN